MTPQTSKWTKRRSVYLLKEIYKPFFLQLFSFAVVSFLYFFVNCACFLVWLTGRFVFYKTEKKDTVTYQTDNQSDIQLAFYIFNLFFIL